MNKILSVVKFLLILIFIVFIITITTYSLVMIFGYDSADSSQWISFLGSIIGGSLTLIGVLMTIRYEDKKYRCQILENNVPIIESIIGDEILYGKTDDGKGSNFIHVIITNNGNGIAKLKKDSIKIECKELDIEDFELKSNFVSCNNDITVDIPILGLDTTKKRKAEITIIISYYDKFEKQKFQTATIISVEVENRMNVILNCQNIYKQLE